MADMHTWFFNHEWLQRIAIDRIFTDDAKRTAHPNVWVTGTQPVTMMAPAPFGLKPKPETETRATVIRRSANRIHARANSLQLVMELQQPSPADVQLEVQIQGWNERVRSSEYRQPSPRTLQMGRLTLQSCCVDTLDRIAIVQGLEYRFAVVQLLGTLTDVDPTNIGKLAAVLGQNLAQKMGGESSAMTRLLTYQTRTAITTEATRHRGTPLESFWNAFAKAWNVNC